MKVQWQVTFLIEVGRRLKENVRKSDWVARLGGDEYAVLLTNLRSEDSASRIARKLLSIFESPVRFGRKSVNVSGSLGVRVMRGGMDSNPLSVLKQADIALYQAKHAGRSTFVVYSPDLERTLRHRSAMVEALRRAISKNNLQVALQPQVRFSDGGHAGFEALVRWKKENQWVPALEIVSLAEQSGLISQLGRSVILSTLKLMQDMKRKGHVPGEVAINVAAAQLRNADFAGELLSSIKAYGHSPSEIVIEVTENVILDQSGEAVGVTLSQLSDAGVKIALDDFGTGYASLTHLLRYPISSIKIDRTFVADLNRGNGCRAIVKAVTSLAHGLRMQVVAEGIESQAQYEQLAAMGCDLAQGYLVARPLLGEQIDTYFANGAPIRSESLVA